MKIISYRHYVYGGTYSDKVIDVPDDCEIYSIYPTTRYFVKDMSDYTSDYLLVSSEPIECEGFNIDHIKIGGIYYVTITNVYIMNSIDLKLISELPPIKNSYVVVKREDEKAKDLYRLCSTDIATSFIKKNYDGSFLDVVYSAFPELVYSMYKLLKFTISGVTAVRVTYSEKDEVFCIENELLDYRKLGIVTILESDGIKNLYKTLFTKTLDTLYCI